GNRAGVTSKDLCGRSGLRGSNRAPPAAANAPLCPKPEVTGHFGSGGGRESNPPADSRRLTGFEDRGGHQPSFASAVKDSGGRIASSVDGADRRRRDRGGGHGLGRGPHAR